LSAEKGAMDYIIKLNDASDGLVGMGIVAGSVAGGPILDTVSGLGQMAMGMKAIKDLNMLTYLKNLSIVSKLSAAANWILNSSLWGMIAPILANPITWLVIALVALAAGFIWAYQNVDWFRAMVDNAWASIVAFGQQIYSFVAGAIAAFVAWTDGGSAQISGFVRWLISALVSAGSALIGNVSSTFSAVWSIISSAINMWNQATAKAREIATAIGNAFSGVKGRIQSAFSGVTSAITSPFMSAYNTVKPIIDAIKFAYEHMNVLGSSGITTGSAGISVGSAGVSMGSVNSVGSANSSLMTNTNLGGTNITLNGIIEESAGEFIVRKLNDEIYKQNTLRGI